MGQTATLQPLFLPTSPVCGKTGPWSSDYYFLQETTLNASGQKTFTKLLHTSAYQSLFSKPSDYKLSGKQKTISLWNARSGGLASVARLPWFIPRILLLPMDV